VRTSTLITFGDVDGSCNPSPLMLFFCVIVF